MSELDAAVTSDSEINVGQPGYAVAVPDENRLSDGRVVAGAPDVGGAREPNVMLGFGEPGRHVAGVLAKRRKTVRVGVEHRCHNSLRPAEKLNVVICDEFEDSAFRVAEIENALVTGGSQLRR